MFHNNSQFQFLRALCSLLVLLFLLPAWACQGSNLPGPGVINASGVRLRANPDTKSKVLNSLSFGAFVKVLERGDSKVAVGKNQDYWYKIESSTRDTGWVFGSFLRRYTEENKDETLLNISRERMKKELSLYESIELSRFARKAAREGGGPEEKGELELIALKALSRSLQNGRIPGAWKKSNKKLIYEDYAQGMRVKVDAFWKLSEKYKKNKIGDTIAWAAVEHGGGGECEGDESCYLVGVIRAEGEYLKRFPGGAHVKDALKRIQTQLGAFKKYVKGEVEIDKTFITEELTGLTGILKKVSGGNQNGAQLKKESLVLLDAIQDSLK